MTCPFDRETLAQYANDDLPAALREATETHLQTCQACRLVVEQYKEGAEALAGAVAAVSLPPGMSQPLPGRRPAWPVWVTTAAVTACMLFVLQLPAVAEQLRSIQVTFFGEEQVREYAEHVQGLRLGTTEAGPGGVPYLTVEEAGDKYHRPVAVPAYLPEGYKLRYVAVYRGDPVPWTRQDYFVTGPYSSLLIYQRPAREPMQVSYPEGEQPQVVDVNGAEGYIAETSIQVNYDGTYALSDDRYRSLTFEWNGDIVVIQSMSVDYPQKIERLSTEELLKIAESIN